MTTIVSGTPGDDTLWGSYYSVIEDDYISFYTYDGDDTIYANKYTVSIDGGDGIDTLTLDRYETTIDLGYTYNQTTLSDISLADGTYITGIELFSIMTSGSGNDTVAYVFDESLADSGSGISFYGNDGIDTATFDFSDYTRDLDIIVGPNDLEVNWNIDDNHPKFASAQAEILSLISGSGDDQLDITANGEYVLTVDTGDGIDGCWFLDLSDYTQDISINFDETSPSKITLPDGSSIDGVEYYTYIATGTGDDAITYVFDPAYSDEFYDFEGGDGTDSVTLDMSNYSKAFQVDIHKDSIGVYNYIGNDSIFHFITAASFENITYISGSGADDINFYGDASATIYSGAGNDAIEGGCGGDTMYGQGGADTLEGEDGNDTLYGGSGQDTLDGGEGIDTMYGGIGNDTYYVDEISDKVVEYAKGGFDRVISTASYSLVANSQYIETLVLSGDEAVRGTGNALNNTIKGTSEHNVLIGLNGNDTLYGFGGADTLNGGSGNDTLYGHSGIDTLIGGNGSDILNGGAGADSMYGGKGNDTYIVNISADKVMEYANQGTDLVKSSATFSLVANSQHIENLILTGKAAIDGTGNMQDNVIKGNISANALKGLNGDDTLHGYGGNDTLSGGNGNDTLTGDNGADKLFGDAGADKLYGGAGDDNLYGGTGNDTLYGNAGADKLYGGTGADTFVGGWGADVMYAGKDAVTDSFVFNSVNDSKVGALHDTIYLFDSGEDDINLLGIDANSSATGDQAFTFADTAAANSVWYEADGSNLMVYGDTNGDAVADFQIELVKVSSLAEADFVL